MYKAVLLLLLLCAVLPDLHHATQGRLKLDFPQLNNIRTKVAADTQADAARDLIRRLINDRVSDFNISVDESIGPKDRDTFKLSSAASGKIQIVGTSGVAVSMGFYYYLKYYCNGQRTWAGQQTQLPATLPPVQGVVSVTTNDRYRYYQNVCTESYTFAFWQWDRWEREIDWMALQGINLPLAFVGQEAIFEKVYLNLGFNNTDMDEHFAGPAFLAWGRMGNIRRWGGPLPQMWKTNKLILQHKILQRMRSLGMIPVLPGFAGHVPAGITRVFPSANVTRLPLWGSFNKTYSATYLLGFDDPLFMTIGKAFIQEMINEFGTNHIYNADTFNEMTPASSDPKYLETAGKAVFKAMTAGDPQAVWLMQGWLFRGAFWQKPQVKALVTSVPQGSMIILDLDSELYPVYQKQESYYGQPFIWCMLHNFGGTMELYGDIDSINKGPFEGRAFPNSTMIGVGITPEGIHQNEVIYEFMNENAWRKQPRDIMAWVTDFAAQRYGASSPEVTAAWKLLMQSVYNCTDGHGDFDSVLITTRPSPNYNVRSHVWYKPEDLFSAWDGFLNASHDLQGSQLFHYDMADVTRNSLQIIALQFYSDLISGFQKKDISTVRSSGAKIEELLADMDVLLASNERFLLGTWIAEALSWATDSNEKKLYEYNARNQITLWGPDGQISDYASKQWSGVTADFYKQRWGFFTEWVVQLIQNGTKWDSNVFKERIMSTLETPWTESMDPYPIHPKGNPITISQSLHKKYRPASRHPFFHHIWKEGQTRPSSWSRYSIRGLP